MPAGALSGRLRNLVVGVQFRDDAGPKLDNLDQKVNRVKFSFQGLGQTMDRVGKWGMLRITAPLLALGGLMTKAASWAEEMESKFNVVFGSMGESARQWAADTASAIGRSRLDLMDYLANTQNLLVGMGQNRDEAALFSREIVQMGVDLASFNNLAESDAINSLQSAMVGAHLAARSLGAVLNENTLALAMQDMGLRGTFQQLDENRKMQVRFRAIVMQSEDAIGDALRTSGSFENQLRGLKGEVKDLSAELGQILLPYATQFIGVLRQGVAWFGELSPAAKSGVMAFGAILAVLFPVVWALGRVIWLGGQLKAGWIWLAAKLAPLAATLGVPFWGLIAIIGGVILVVQDFWTWFKGGESVIGGVFGKIAEFGRNSLATIRGWVAGAKVWLDNLVQGFANLPGRIMDAIKGLGSKLKDAFVGGLAKIRNLLPFSPVRDLTSPLRDLEKAGMNIVGNIRHGMQQALSQPGFGTPVAATAGPVMSGRGAYTFAPVITVSVPPGSNARETAQLTRAELERALPGLMDDFFRRAGRRV